VTGASCSVQRVQDFETTIRVVIFTGGKVTVNGGTELPKEKLWTLLLQQAMTRGASSCGVQSDCTAKDRAEAAMGAMQEVVKRLGTELYPLEDLASGIDPAWCDTAEPYGIAHHTWLFPASPAATLCSRGVDDEVGLFMKTMWAKWAACINRGCATNTTDNPYTQFSVSNKPEARYTGSRSSPSFEYYSKLPADSTRSRTTCLKKPSCEMARSEFMLP
jgi:hypothetical protein